MSYADHDHCGEYADQRHDHDGDYAERYHGHDHADRDHDHQDLLEQIHELGERLEAAVARIRELEGQTPQARQLQLEADLAAADLAESGYDREYDPGPEVDDKGGMSEYRYLLPEDYERGQS